MKRISTFSKRLKEYRASKGYTLSELEKLTGVPSQTLNRYELEQRVPKVDVVNDIAEKLGINTLWMQGFDINADNNSVLSGNTDKEDDAARTKYQYIPTQGTRLNADYSDDEMVQFPVIGEIAAGFDSSIFTEDTGDYVSIPRSALSGRPASDYFVLRVKGNSMYPMYLAKDKVLILKTNSVDSGSVAVVQYNGDEASLKKVVYVPGEDWFDMIPINPEYRPKRISGPSLMDCHILGLAKMLIRDIDQECSEIKKHDGGTIRNIIKMAYSSPGKYLKIARGEGGVVEEITDPKQQEAIERMLKEPFEDVDF